MASSVTGIKCNLPLSMLKVIKVSNPKETISSAISTCPWPYLSRHLHLLPSGREDRSSSAQIAWPVPKHQHPAKIKVNVANPDDLNPDFPGIESALQKKTSLDFFSYERSSCPVFKNQFFL